MLFCFLFQHGNSKSVTLKFFFRTQTSVFPVEVFAMDRFVGKRSSSSGDLDASSLDDVRAERAPIALSVGLSWPPDRYTKQTRCRPSKQQLWERALQDHIMNHHELPHGIRLQRPDWWRPEGAIDRPLTHEEIAHTSTPCATPQRGKTPQNPRRPLRARLVPRHVLPHGAHRSAWVRSGACVLGCSRGSTRTLLTTGKAARHEQHRSAGELCCHPQT